VKERERERERKRERERESFQSNLHFEGFLAATNPIAAEKAKMIPHQIPDPISFSPKKLPFSIRID
jgi:hypothetical protein